MNTAIILCGYIMVIIFALYTFLCFTAFMRRKKRRNSVFIKQRICIFLIMGIAHLILYYDMQDKIIITLFAGQCILYTAAFVLYGMFYRGLSKLVLNNMIMLVMIGIFMLERINPADAVKQFYIACGGIAVCLIIPVIIKKFKYMDRLGIVYGAAGILLLAVLLIFAKEIYGAKNWIVIGGIAFQPSEFVKILFVFFTAAMLTKRKDFMYVLAVSALAAAHVLVLVLEKDLGGALIYFVTYLFMLVAITGNYMYLIAGLTGGSLAGFAAFKLFSHVRTRFLAWSDPWSIIDTGGYQVTQSLFAIASGGLFGLGLGKGIPKVIPVVESDFIFSAICEELGVLFALFILLVYLSCFIMFINISLRIKEYFYRYVSFGLGIMFIFQVFLAVGGVTKFIPSTGVTLPLISYGGSSVLSTIILFSIIQGIYVLKKSEDKIVNEGQGKEEYRQDGQQ